MKRHINKYMEVETDRWIHTRGYIIMETYNWIHKMDTSKKRMSGVRHQVGDIQTHPPGSMQMETHIWIHTNGNMGMGVKRKEIILTTTSFIKNDVYLNTSFSVRFKSVIVGSSMKHLPARPFNSSRLPLCSCAGELL